MPRLIVGIVLIGLVGCGQATLESSVRPEASLAEQIIITHPGPRVEVSDAEFRKAMAWLSADLVSARLSFDGAREGGRVVHASWAPGTASDAAATQLTREYAAWCQLVRHGPADCLSLNVESFGPEDKRKLALSIAIGSVLEGVMDVVGEFANPIKVEAMIVTSMAAYLFLLYAPEPITKGIAAVATLGLYLYLGDELWEIARAYGRMHDEADAATTFAEVRAAGERFGRSIGQKAMQILIMAVTARLGSKTTADLAGKVQQLPRFVPAAEAVSLTGRGQGLLNSWGGLAIAGVFEPMQAVVLSKTSASVVVPITAVAMGTPPEKPSSTPAGARPKPVNLPAWKDVGIDMDHIASGHMRGGLRVGPRKDLFPDHMTRAQVESAVRQAYRYGDRLATQGARVLIEGPGPGFRIRMWVNLEAKVIETAFPAF